MKAWLENGVVTVRREPEADGPALTREEWSFAVTVKDTVRLELVSYEALQRETASQRRWERVPGAVSFAIWNADERPRAATINVPGDVLAAAVAEVVGRITLFRPDAQGGRDVRITEAEVAQA